MQHTTHYVPFARELSISSRVSPYVRRAAACVLAGMLTLSISPVVPYGLPEAYAVTAAEKQAEAEQALANLNAMQETLDRLSMEYGDALAAQEEAEATRDATEVRIREIEERKSDLQNHLSDRAREMYRNGGVSFLEILLDTNSFEEFATRWDILNKVNENDAAMVEEQKALQIEAEEQYAILSEQADIAAQKSQEAAEAAQQAEATVAEMQATYDSLSAEAARLLEEERKAREAEEAARAAAVVAASVAAAQQQAAQNSNQTGNSASSGAAASGGSNSADSNTAGNGGAATDSQVAQVTPQTADTTGNGGSQPAESGSDTVSRAYSCLGSSYVWGGVGPGGYDCSGLVSYCLTGEHTRLGTTSTFMGWPQVSDPQPGDIAVNWGHTGIYIGNGRMIHAATYGVGVIVGPVQSGMIIVRWQG